MTLHTTVQFRLDVDDRVDAQWAYTWDVGNDRAIARQRFALDADAEVTEWFAHVVTTNLRASDNECPDCGNTYDGDVPHGGHAPDCDYAER